MRRRRQKGYCGDVLRAAQKEARDLLRVVGEMSGNGSQTGGSYGPRVTLEFHGGYAIMSYDRRNAFNRMFRSKGCELSRVQRRTS